VVGSCCAKVDFAVVVEKQLAVSMLTRAVKGTHILVDTEHFKVYRLGPLVVVEDVIRRNIEPPWLLVLWLSTDSLNLESKWDLLHLQADHIPH